AFHTSVQLHKASGQMLVEELQQRIGQAQRNDKELVIDPALFGELGRRWEKIGWVNTALKAGSYDNELSRFRYDVTLHLGKKEQVMPPDRWLVWDEAGSWRQALAEAARLEPHLAFGVRGIRDRRVAGAVKAIGQLYASENAVSNAQELRQECLSVGGEDPNAVIQTAKRLGVSFCWQ